MLQTLAARFRSKSQRCRRIDDAARIDDIVTLRGPGAVAPRSCGDASRGRPRHKLLREIPVKTRSELRRRRRNDAAHIDDVLRRGDIDDVCPGRGGLSIPEGSLSELRPCNSDSVVKQPDAKQASSPGSTRLRRRSMYFVIILSTVEFRLGACSFLSPNLGRLLRGQL
jgi:hypothetical protein